MFPLLCEIKFYHAQPHRNTKKQMQKVQTAYPDGRSHCNLKKSVQLSYHYSCSQLFRSQLLVNFPNFTIKYCFLPRVEYNNRPSANFRAFTKLMTGQTPVKSINLSAHSIHYSIGQPVRTFNPLLNSQAV